MTKVKDYYGENFLSIEENIKLDFIHAEPEGYEKHSPTLYWDLTINTGEKDEQGCVDALIIRITDKQFSSFLDRKHGKEGEVEFSIIQVPMSMTRTAAKRLVSNYALGIYDSLDEFENED